MRFPGLVALLCLAGCGGGKRGPAPLPATVIEGATWIGEHGEAVADSVVVVRGNRIEAAGPRASVTIPTDAQRVDAAGLFLIPGMMDLHVHLGATGGPGFRPGDYTPERIRKNLDSYLYHGVTTVRSAGTERAEGFEIRNAQRAAPVTTRLFTAGRGFTGVRGHPSQEIGDIARQPATPEDARAQVREITAQQADLIKIWIDGKSEIRIKPETVEAILDEAGRSGIPVHAHIRYYQDARHFFAKGGAGFLHMIRDRKAADFEREFLDEIKKRQTVFVPTLVRQELAWLYRDHPERLDDEEVARLVSPETLAAVREAAKKMPAPSALQKEEFALAMANSKALAEAGVAFAVGSDGGSQNDLHGLMTHRECELLQQAGLPPKEVLKAATRNGALALGKSSELGTIAPGKLADIVLLSANPLEDSRNLRKVLRVMLDGKWVDRGALSLK